MADSQVTAWDESGKPIPSAGGVTAWDENGNPVDGGDAIAKQSKAAAIGAGVANAGTALQPLAENMRNAGKAYEASLDPQERYLSQHPEQRERVEAGGSMAFPAAMLALGATSPFKTIAEKGIARYAEPVIRAGVKSYAGSEVGKRVGRGVGGLFGAKGAETGSEVGSIAGGLAGPLVPGRSFAKVPFVGRMAASNEDMAAERAAMKMAQRNADISAGLRRVPTPKAPEPSMIQGTATNAMPPASTALQLPSPSEGPISTTGNAQPTFLREIKRGVEAQDKAPLRPTIGTPEEWKAFDQRMKNLKAEASDAGTFSAARGKVGKKLNYQERIGKAFE